MASGLQWGQVRLEDIGDSPVEDGDEVRPERRRGLAVGVKAGLLLLAAFASLTYLTRREPWHGRSDEGATGDIVRRFFIPFSLPFGSDGQPEGVATTTPMTDDASTLFCFCVMQIGGYEQTVLEVQRRHDAGIFDCNGQMVLADKVVDLGGSFHTTSIGVVASPLGGTEAATRSWVNTEIFLRAWWNVRADGRFANFDWTLKVDPDTVLLPGLLRHHLERRGFNSYLGETSAIYIRNCPVARNGFYGAIEVMSRGAIEDLLNNLDSCRDKLHFKGWGEDLFAQMCMQQAGARAQDDFDLVEDGACRGPIPPDCSPGHPAYHPLKSADLWLRCWNTARTGTPSEIEMRDQDNFGTQLKHLHKFPDIAKLKKETEEEEGPNVFRPSMFSPVPVNSDGSFEGMADELK